MSKSCMITVLALIASVSASPYIYEYGPLSVAPPASYTTAGLYNPAVPALPAPYSFAYSSAYPGSLPGAYAAPLPAAAYQTPLARSYTAPAVLPAALPAYGSTYPGEEYAALVNAAPAPLVYRPPYSYMYKR